MLTHTAAPVRRIARFPLLATRGSRTIIDENWNGRFDRNPPPETNKYTTEPVIDVNLRALKDYSRMNGGFRYVSKENFGELKLVGRLTQQTRPFTNGGNPIDETIVRLSKARNLTQLANEMNPMPGNFSQLDWVIDLGTQQNKQAFLYLVDKNPQ